MSDNSQYRFTVRILVSLRVREQVFKAGFDTAKSVKMSGKGQMALGNQSLSAALDALASYGPPSEWCAQGLHTLRNARLLVWVFC